MPPGPPRSGPGNTGQQPRFNLRPDHVGERSSPEVNQPPRKKGTPDRNVDPRISQYSASVYSNNSSPNASPEVPQMPSFAEMHASLRRNNSNGRSLKRASSYYSENPFMDNIPEHPDEHRRSRSSSASSGQFSVYRPEKAGVISPFDGEPKGLDGIIAGSKKPVDAGLVRQASLGKRQKAALTNVRKSEHRSIAPSVREHEDVDDPPTPPEDDFKPHGPPQAAYANRMVPAPLSPSRVNASTFPSNDRTHHQHESSLSPKPGGSWPLRSPAMPSQAKSSLGAPHSRFSREYRPHHSNSNSGGGGKLFLMPQRQRSLKDRVGDKAPSSLNMEAVREAEARGSMTSLPGLLNRAVQLASNLEKGKTSSKQSDWFGNEILKDMSTRGKSTASLNTMLDKFAFSPTVENKHARNRSGFSEKWPRPAPLPPSGLHQQMSAPRDESKQRSRSKYDHRHPPPPRKCCGMPLWLFFLLLVAALVLIVLAVVLPVALIVIPNDKKAADPSCSAKHPCQNDGISVPDQSGACQCICPTGFTGSNCTSTNNVGSCGTISVPGLSNAAIGSQLPLLVTNAQPQYQIPLNATSILTAFSIFEINCDIQNTLVSFTKSVSGRRRAVIAASTDVKPTITSAPMSPHHAGSHHVHEPRQDQAITTGGLVIAGSASSTPSSAQPTASTGAPPTQYTDAAHVDFAKTAILYALQMSQQLNVATTAGNKVQPYVNGLGSPGGDARNVDMGNGWSLDLVGFKVTGMGTSVGSNGGNP